MIYPLTGGTNLLSHACPIDDIMKELSVQLTEFKALKEKQGPGISSS